MAADAFTRDVKVATKPTSSARQGGVTKSPAWLEWKRRNAINPS